jgi:hypothetical protein
MKTFFAALLLASTAFAAEPFRVPMPSSDEVRRIDSDLVSCGTRHSLSSWTDPRRGIGCARDKIRGIFEAARPAAGRVVIDRFEASSERTHGPAPLENVYLVVDGADPLLRKTAFLVSGHFDSICSDFLSPECDAPGADDDASGTTVSLESAILIAKRPHRATLIFAAVSGEEQGLLGGKRLLEWVRAQGYTVGGMLNNDIVGATNGSSDHRPRVFSDTETFSPARELGLWIDEFVGGVRPIFRRDRFGRGGDHLPFVEAGLAAVRFCEPKEDYHHQHQTPRVENGVEYGDLQKFMDFEFLASVARTNAEALDGLGNAPAPPPEATVEGAVAPHATIIFAAPDDPERQGFEILMRDTTEPRWKVAKEVSGPGSYEMPSTIDDAFFAVRAVGRNGLRSIAVDAKPMVKRPSAPTPPR